VKNTLIALCVAGLFSTQANAADLLGSMKKATAKVEETQTKVNETKTAAKDAVSSPDQAALALVKGKLKTGSTKEQVRQELGEPVNVTDEGENSVWSYDVASLNQSLGDKAAVAAAVGVNVPGADKRVAIKFESDKIHSIKIAGE
jgi:outer membrane protein assembly factor BamE (lipoprotein component of BamABCDE complex)